MRPIWILEAGVFGDAIKPLQQELQRQRIEHHFVSYPTFMRGSYDFNGQPPAEDACVIFYGSHPMMHHIRKYHPRWVPGGWCSFENLSCSTYFAYFGRYLLNHQYVMMPGVEAIRQRDFVYGNVGRGDEVFVRPDSVEKVFTGRCVSKPDFGTALAPTRYAPATLVVIAPPRSISREWRLVIADNEVVSGSQYYLDGAPAIADGCPRHVSAFAADVLAEVNWRPDPVFMMDVCEADDGLSLLEINAFSCSGLYAAELTHVVARVSEMAADQWRSRSEFGS